MLSLQSFLRKGVSLAYVGSICIAGSAAILCTGGLDVIRKEAWPFYRTSSGVRLCWELEEPKGPKRLVADLARCRTRIDDVVGQERGSMEEDVSSLQQKTAARSDRPQSP